MKSGRVAALAVVLTVAVGGLTACNDPDQRWCELDATDRVVDASYCKRGLPGYEWEKSDSHHDPKPKVRKK